MSRHDRGLRLSLQRETFLGRRLKRPRSPTAAKWNDDGPGSCCEARLDTGCRCLAGVHQLTHCRAATERTTVRTALAAAG